MPGRVSVRIVDGVAEKYLASARKATDAEAVAQFEQACRALYDQMARIAITPHWARYYDFGAGRRPRFLLQELLEQSADDGVDRRDVGSDLVQPSGWETDRMLLIRRLGSSIFALAVNGSKAWRSFPWFSSDRWSW